MFQLDDKFLQDVGLGGMPEEQKQAFLAYFREQLELRVGTRLSEGLTDAQLDEFESFIDRDEDKVNTWLAANVPNFAEDQVWQQLKAGAPSDIPELVVKAEYASLKWLGLNRPDYRDVVAAVMQELKNETIKNRDAILGTVSEAQTPPQSGQGDQGLAA
ncbi:hypothetical protein KC945_00600 [Candidatus Saccharibacteria bacterium]|nr:hypothetical protein [Candidatus Saccharibacteria bacterium]